jgi:hypothetical protein
VENNTLICVIPTRGGRPIELQRTIDELHVWAEKASVMMSVHVVLDGFEFEAEFNPRRARKSIAQVRLGQDGAARHGLANLEENSIWCAILEDDLRGDASRIMDALWSGKRQAGWHFVHKKGFQSAFRRIRHVVAKALSGAFAKHASACAIATRESWQRVVSLSPEQLWQMEGNRKKWAATSSAVKLREPSLPTSYDGWANWKLVKQIVKAHQDTLIGIWLLCCAAIGVAQFIPKVQEVAYARVLQKEGGYRWEFEPSVVEGKQECEIEVPNNEDTMLRWVREELRLNLPLISIDLVQKNSGWKVKYITKNKTCASTQAGNVKR